MSKIRPERWAMHLRSSVTIILNENFAHVYQETASQSSVETREGVLQNERINPNSFVERGVEPIVDTLKGLFRSAVKQTWRVGKASWAEGYVRVASTSGDASADVVDVGSSKCLRYSLQGDSVAAVAKAPSLTDGLAAIKCSDFGISHVEEEGCEVLAQKQYLKLLPFMLECARDKVKMVATEGVRSFCASADLPSHGLSVHTLLAAPQNPMSAAHGAKANASDIEALSGLPIVVLSCEEEGEMEYADAVRKFKPDRRSENVVFVSMGGSSTQVVLHTSEQGPGEAATLRSFRLGKNWFRRDEAALDEALRELESLLDFLKLRIAGQERADGQPTGGEA